MSSVTRQRRKRRKNNRISSPGFSPIFSPSETLEVGNLYSASCLQMIHSSKVSGSPVTKLAE
ncbi:hypothetical protein ACET3Z_011394 [Daucus carota]